MPEFLRDVPLNILAQTEAEVRRIGGKNIRRIAEAYENEFMHGPWLQNAHAALAAAAQEAILAAYQTNVLAEKAAPSYREGDRYSGGILEEALASPDFVEADQTGVRLINLEILDQKARFWARLNFGAGPAEGSRPAPRARVQFGANQGFTLSLNSAPRPNFNVPESPGDRGYFNAQNQFFPGTPTGDRASDREGAHVVKRRPSQHGIGARRFLDAGLVAFADEFKGVYQAELDDAARNASYKARGGS